MVGDRPLRRGRAAPRCRCSAAPVRRARGSRARARSGWPDSARVRGGARAAARGRRAAQAARDDRRRRCGAEPLQLVECLAQRVLVVGVRERERVPRREQPSSVQSRRRRRHSPASWSRVRLGRAGGIRLLDAGAPAPVGELSEVAARPLAPVRSSNMASVVSATPSGRPSSQAASARAARDRPNPPKLSRRRGQPRASSSGVPLPRVAAPRPQAPERHERDNGGEPSPRSARTRAATRRPRPSAPAELDLAPHRDQIRPQPSRSCSVQ